jgi:hypothetical protein
MTPIRNLEGTWEEIQERAHELAGKRVRLSVLPDADPGDVGLPRENIRMLELLADWKQTELSPEEESVLDEFDPFRAEHPFRLKDPCDVP